ncbi:MAG: hypothetical protein J0H68_02015 [Sphingobacteriia bacterium]|nr:hypothetical protein [Sphingobacteriia bacterium]
MSKVKFVYVEENDEHFIVPMINKGSFFKKKYEAIKDENNDDIKFKCTLDDVNITLTVDDTDELISFVYTKDDFNKDNNIGGWAAYKSQSSIKNGNALKFLLGRNFKSSATHKDLLDKFKYAIEITLPNKGNDVTSQVDNIRKEAVEQHKELKKEKAAKDLLKSPNFKDFGKQYLFRAAFLAVGAALAYFLLPRAGRFLNNFAIRYFNKNFGTALNNAVDSGVNLAANYVIPKLPVQLQNLTNQATVSNLVKKGGKAAAYAGATVLGAGTTKLFSEAVVDAKATRGGSFIPTLKTSRRLIAESIKAVSRPDVSTMNKSRS